MADRREFLRCAVAASAGGILLNASYGDEKEVNKRIPIKIAQIGTGQTRRTPADHSEQRSGKSHQIVLIWDVTGAG